MDKGYLVVFVNIDGIEQWLRSLYIDPNKKNIAREAYRALTMSLIETFNNFYGQFSILATRARIDAEESLSNLFYKLTLELYRSLILYILARPTLKEALRYIQFYDNELRLA